GVIRSIKRPADPSTPRGNPGRNLLWGFAVEGPPLREGPLDEAQLIGAAKAGDREAFDELVRRTFVDTFTLARRLTGNEEDARHWVQDAYVPCGQVFTKGG